MIFTSIWYWLKEKKQDVIHVIRKIFIGEKGTRVRSSLLRSLKVEDERLFGRRSNRETVKEEIVRRIVV